MFWLNVGEQKDSNIQFKMAGSQRAGHSTVRPRTCFCLGNGVPKVTYIILEETTGQQPVTFEIISLLITHTQKNKNK